MNYNTGDNKTNNKLLSILYKNPKSAERAYNLLISKGVNKDDISIIMSNETHEQYFKNIDISKDGLGSKALEKGGAGSAIGGIIGALTAAVAAIGTTLVIPVAGLVIAGPIAAALAGAGAGGAVGGAIGALVGLGIPDEQAKQYENDVKAGGILITVKTTPEKFGELQAELNKLSNES